MADPVQLTDLDVITRYSIAVRRATVDRTELIATLRGDLAWLEHGRRRDAWDVTQPMKAEPPSNAARPETTADQPSAPKADVVSSPPPPPPEPAPQRQAAAKRSSLPPPAKPAAKKAPAKRTAAKPAAKRAPAKRATKRAR